MAHVNQSEIDKLVSEVRTTLDIINNLVPNEFSKNLKEKYLNDEITSEEVIQIIKNNNLTNK